MQNYYRLREQQNKAARRAKSPYEPVATITPPGLPTQNYNRIKNQIMPNSRLSNYNRLREQQNQAVRRADNPYEPISTITPPSQQPNLQNYEQIKQQLGSGAIDNYPSGTQPGMSSGQYQLITQPPSNTAPGSSGGFGMDDVVRMVNTLNATPSNSGTTFNNIGPLIDAIQNMRNSLG